MPLLKISAADPLNFAPLILGVVAAAALFGALIGFWRGIARQTVKLCATLVSILATYGLSVLIFKKVWEKLAGKSVADIESLISKIGIDLDLSRFYDLEPESAALIIAVVIALVVLPILFIPLFIAVNSISHLVYRLISYLCGFKSDRNTMKTRFLGSLAGIVEALVFIGVILTPAVGLSEIARDSVAVMENHAPDESFTHKASDKYTAYVKSVSESKVIRIYEKLGAGMLYEKIATLKIDGEQKNMTNLTEDVAILVSDTMAFKGTNPKHLTEEDKARIKSMISVIGENPYLSEIVAGALRSTSKAYENDAFHINIPSPYDELVKSVLDMFSTIEPENVEPDLTTIADAYFVLSDSGALSAFNDGATEMILAMSTLDDTGASTASRVIDVLRENERTAPIVTLTTKLLFTVMGCDGEVGDVMSDAYDSVKNQINTSLVTVNKSDFATEEEYTEKISEELNVLLTENDIEIEDEMILEMAEFYTKNFSDAEVITDDMVIDIIVSYYDVYLNYVSDKTE